LLHCIFRIFETKILATTLYLLSIPSKSIPPFINWFGVHFRVNESIVWCSER